MHTAEAGIGVFPVVALGKTGQREKYAQAKQQPRINIVQLKRAVHQGLQSDDPRIACRIVQALRETVAKMGDDQAHDHHDDRRHHQRRITDHPVERPDMVHVRNSEATQRHGHRHVAKRQ
ncbi:hypothetical protein D3C86_1780740 [compost metagenome]